MIYIEKEKRKNSNYRGFTLAEMLIVIAIIGALIAILIPVLTTELEKARETKDIASIRSAISVVQSAAIFNEADDTNEVYYNKTNNYYYKKVPITQKYYNWAINNNSKSYTLFSGEDSIDVYYTEKDHEGFTCYLVIVYPATSKIKVGPMAK